MPHFYRLYGLVAASDLQFPELLPTESSIKPDIIIKYGDVPSDGLDGARKLGPFSFASSGKFWLSIPKVARFQVSDGGEIIVDPVPNIDEDSIRVFLLGSCIGALLHQRGYLLLHGNAIELEDGCLVCAGKSGIGKSTLAAAFLRQGHRILADDMAAIDEHDNAIPGFPRIKLWQDSAEKLQIDTSGLRRIRPEMEKYDYPLGASFHENPLPVKWVYIIETHKESGFSLKEIKGLDKYLPLRENTYRPRFMQGMKLEPSHLKLCGNLAGNIRLARIKRPQWGFEVEELAEFIKNDALNHR